MDPLPRLAPTAQAPYGGGGAPAAEIEVPAGRDVPRAGAEASLNWPLLGAFLVILGLVVASNVWLRRRAERERKPEEDEPA